MWFVLFQAGKASLRVVYMQRIILDVFKSTNEKNFFLVIGMGAYGVML